MHEFMMSERLRKEPLETQ